tara:strand:- start:1711 stop:2157 length:447 start_codon:yes stop_codon:yes gene_type:complete
MAKLLAFFVIVPALELWLLLYFARFVGIAGTIFLIIATGIVGGALARQQGWNLIRQARRELEAGRIPKAGLLEAAIILVAGAFLLTPGILTDLAGFFFLMPRIRRRLVERLELRLRNNKTRQNVMFHNNSRFEESETIDITPTEREEE